jgi:hypothetical protein
MLDTEDIDKVIELLQTNDWDESKAAQAFFSLQEVQNIQNER